MKTTFSELSIGKGKYMSIAKAALKYYFEEFDFYDTHGEEAFLEYGNLPAMHRIVDIAGCKIQGPVTPSQVTSRLSNSPYWESDFCKGFYAGMMGNGGASLFNPSKKGKEYYKTKMKKDKILIDTETINQTSIGCPSQWDAKTVGSSYNNIYIRVRHGYFRVDMDNDTVFDGNPDNVDGVMSTKEMIEYVNENSKNLHFV